MGTPVFTGFPPVELPTAPTTSTNSSTPMKPKHAQSAPSILNGIESGRTAVIQDTGEVIRQVSLDYFTQSLLPELPDGLDLDAVVERLKDDKKITKGGYWSGFSKYPASSTRVEDVTFRPFETVAASIGSAAMEVFPGHEQHVVFKCNPTAVPLSSLRLNTSRPDCYGLYKRHHRYGKQDDSVHWETVSATGELKKESTPETITDNNRKIMWSMNHIMREDVRRRFVFGYTIENYNMRIWFASRADILVSKSFNFIKDHKTFVHFILSFMYASEEQLGYDITMKPVLSPSGLMRGTHNVAVRGPSGRLTWYRTTRMIYNIGAESIRGRATRVWVAREVKNGRMVGDPVVLKDTWIDDDRQREGAIVDLIKNSAKTDEQRGTLNQSLLTILAHGDVYIDGKHDQTHTLLRRNSVVPHDLEHYPLKWPTDSGHDSASEQVLEDIPKAPVGSGTIRPKEKRTPLPLDYGVKAHYRIVFKEVGKSIESLDTVGEIFEMLLETLFAVEVLHQLGWLHRDLSSGNLLVYEGHVKITDFEYAKHVDDKSDPHNLRTGTAHFMAVEADDHTWRFRPKPEATATKVPPIPQSAKDRWQAWKANRNDHVAQTRPSDATVSVNLPAFRHIALHDLESIWWLAVYLAIDRSVVIAATEQVTQYYRAHRQFYNKMFPPTSCRYLMFSDTGQFSAGEKDVHQSMLRAAKGLEDARSELVAAYCQAEKDIDGITHEVGVTVIARMQEIFMEIAMHYTDHPVELQKIPHGNRKCAPEPAAPIEPGQSLDGQRILVGRKRGRDSHARSATQAKFGEAGPSSSKSIATKRSRQEAASAVPEDEASLQAAEVDEAATTPPRSRSPSVASTMTVPLTIPIPRGKGKGKERARD